MGVATGIVVAGKVQLDGVALPEGAVVTVLTPDATDSLRLDEDEEAELLDAIAEAERGETLSSDELFARLDARAKP